MTQQEENQPCLRQVSDQLMAMENHWRSVSDYVDMLVILTAQPDAEGAMDGIHRLLHQIDDHATAVGEHWEAAWAALRSNGNAPDPSSSGSDEFAN